MTQTALAETIEPATSEVAVYAPLRQQLAEIKEHNFKMVFDYADKAGNEAARSHIYKLRKTKAAIEAARKAEKAESLAYGRKVDAEAQVLISEVEEMIEIHQKPLEEFEAAEQARIDGIMQAINNMTITAESVINKTSEQLKSRLNDLNAMVIDDATFGEFLSQGIASRQVAVEYLTGAIGIAEKREEEAAELAQLRAEAEARRLADEEAARVADAAEAERLRIDREAAEAAQRAEDERKRAEEQAARDEQIRLEAAERERLRVENEAAERERLLREQAEKAEREKLELEEKAKRDAKAAEERQAEAVTAERERIEREAATKTAENARREADKQHRGKIHTEIVTAIIALNQGITEEQARAIVVGICGDVVPNLKIIY